MLRGLKIFAIFALLCPPLTGLATAVLVSASLSLRVNGVGEGSTPLLQQALLMAVYAVPMSYVMGGVQAVFVGTVSAIWAGWKGTLPLAVPLTCSLLAWLAFCVSISSPLLGDGQPFSEVALSVNGVFLLVIHLVAGLLGWWMARRLDRAQTR